MSFSGLRPIEIAECERGSVRNVCALLRNAPLAASVRRGLRRAAIWIGEFGAWKKAENRYRSAVHLTIEGRIEVDTAVHDEILGRFGVKYVKEWGTWGPRFRTELADGSRVMLRYQVVS